MSARKRNTAKPHSAASEIPAPSRKVPKVSRVKKDPLLQALIAKLPQEADWPVERQLSWLNLMAMAFGTVYGGDAAQRLGIKAEPLALEPSPSPTPKEPPKPKEPDYPFIIDKGGFVMRGNGEPVLPGDVTGTIYDTRGQDGDIRTIVWADGSMGLNGADLTISAV